MHACYALGTAMPRARTARATILMTRINPSNTSPAAQACRCQSSYGARAYLKIISGSEAVGWLQPGLQNRFPKAVKSSGAVSPATRANASSTAVRIPLYAAGTITVAIVFHLLAPSAIAASRSARGTASKNSSVLRSVIGIIISPSAKPPARVEKCLNGSTTRLYAKIPITIDGTPFSKSAARFSNWLGQFREEAPINRGAAMINEVTKNEEKYADRHQRAHTGHRQH